MEFNKDTLKKLMDTDDESLKLRVLMLCKELNIDKSAVTPFFADMTALRKMLMNLSQSDIERAKRAFEKKKSENSRQNIKKGE